MLYLIATTSGQRAIAIFLGGETESPKEPPKCGTPQSSLPNKFPSGSHVNSLQVLYSV